MGCVTPCACVNFDSKAVYQSLHQLTIIPPILGSATLVTRNKSWELPTNCRKTMLVLVRFFELNECHRRGDLEPQHAETKRSPRTPNQSTTLRLPTRTFIWRPKPRHPHWFPTCQRLIRVPLTRSNSAAPGTADIVSMCARARSIQWSPWWLSLGQKTAARYSGISGFAAQQSDCPRVFRLIRPKQPIASQNSCSARGCLISSHCGRPVGVIGCNGTVYKI